MTEERCEEGGRRRKERGNERVRHGGEERGNVGR